MNGSTLFMWAVTGSLIGCFGAITVFAAVQSGALSWKFIKELATGALVALAVILIMLAALILGER